MSVLPNLVEMVKPSKEEKAHEEAIKQVKEKVETEAQKKHSKQPATEAS